MTALPTHIVLARFAKEGKKKMVPRLLGARLYIERFFLSPPASLLSSYDNIIIYYDMRDLRYMVFFFEMERVLD